MSAQTLDARMGGIEARMARVEGVLEQVDKRVDSIDRRFNWVIGLIVTSWMTTILTILFHR